MVADKTFFIQTLGCKTNQSESDEISAKLSDRGFNHCSLEDSPSFMIINTCTVTSTADKKVRQFISRAKKANPQTVLIAAGCSSVFQSQILKDCGADYVFSNSEKDKIPDFITAYSGSGNEGGCNGRKNTVGLNAASVKIAHNRVMVKIQEGCEQNCSYCIVPYVRGPNRSEKPEIITDRIKEFYSMGFEEVVLTGTHIGKYDADDGLCGLLDRILDSTKIKRVRLSSVEINEVDADLINILKSNPARIAPHLHIPLQSGSDIILKAMNRRYTADFFRQRVREMCAAIPGVALTTDVITGFPGETEDDFLKTLELVEELNFTKTHVFTYSKRNGTAAAVMPGQVESSIKKVRSRLLRELGNKLRVSFLKENRGNILDTVCESFNRLTGISEGTSGNYLRVFFSTSVEEFEKYESKIVRIKTDKIYNSGLYGKLC